MTYTFTYTILTHNFVEHEGDYVITNIDYRVTCNRSDSKSCTFDLTLPFSRDSKNKVIPRTRQKYDASDNVLAENAWENRSDFTSYASLTIPADLVTWVTSYHEDDANRLQGLKQIADKKIGS
tara:strand:+ start:334 stop:702 length:369 start_codon:yes stop_codon:yes gene_type:complete